MGHPHPPAVLNGRHRAGPYHHQPAAGRGLLPYSSFVVSKALPPWPLGLAVVAIACIAEFGRLGHGTQEQTTTPEQRQRLADRFGNKLFLPCWSSPSSPA